MKKIVCFLSCVVLLFCIAGTKLASAKSDGFYIVEGTIVKYTGKGGNVVIPSGVTRIKSWVFTGCKSLTSITIPSSVTRIDFGQFSGCENLTSITLPSSLTVIENGLFEKCSKLTNISIPSGVTDIYSYAFNNCTGLKNITLPSKVSKISMEAFSGCSQLESIVMLSETPPTLEEEVFKDTPDSLVIHVPNTKAVSNYTAAGWERYGKITTP